MEEALLRSDELSYEGRVQWRRHRRGGFGFWVLKSVVLSSVVLLSVDLSGESKVSQTAQGKC